MRISLLVLIFISFTYPLDQGCPSVTFDGTNYPVVGEDDRSDAFRIYGRG